MSVIKSFLTGTVENDTETNAGIGTMRFELNLNGSAGNGAIGNVPLGEYVKDGVRTNSVVLVTNGLQTSTTAANTLLKIQLSNGTNLTDTTNLEDLNANEAADLDVFFKEKSTSNDKGIRLNIAGGNVSGRLTIIVTYLLP